MKEAGLGDKGMVSGETVQKLGRLEGVTAVVYGKIIPTGNYLRLFTKVVILEKQVNTISVRGGITRTPTIDKLMGMENDDVLDSMDSRDYQPQNLTPNRGGSTQYVNKNIQIRSKGCRRNGTSVDCEVQIYNLGGDDSFTLKSNGTKLLDRVSGKYYYAKRLTSQNKRSSVQVNRPIRQNQSMTATIKFASVPSIIGPHVALELNCSSYLAYSFTAQLENVKINK